MRQQPTEAQECKWFQEWASTQRHAGYKLSDLLIHIPNERKCSYAQGALLKRMGVKKGVPDYLLPIGLNGSNGTHGAHGLFVEMKRKGNNNHKTKPEQDAWIEILRNLGYHAVYAYGWEEAAKAVTTYLTSEGREC